LAPKKPRTLEIKSEVKKKPSTPRKTGLSKSDPDYYKKIGQISARKRKLTSEDYAAMAVLSHAPTSRRDRYHGGRPKKENNE